MYLPALAGALALALVHLFAGRLRFLEVVPRSRWLSFASGTSVAYVFLHLFPELGEFQQHLERAPALAWLDDHAFLLATLGLAAFYGLERLAEESRGRRRRDQGEDCTSPGVFWLHIGAFALYNAAVGYLLANDSRETDPSFVLLLVAIGFHFLVNDFGLRLHHKDAYRSRGRWVLAASVLLGTGARTLVALPLAWVHALMSLLAGAIVLNVLKEELPEERQSRFGSFALGILVFVVLLQAV